MHKKAGVKKRTKAGDRLGGGGYIINTWSFEYAHGLVGGSSTGGAPAVRRGTS